jgi:methylaspartate mutase sigma subunit
MTGLPQPAHVAPADAGADSRLVILGVAASDSHAVANHLIAHGLGELGYAVVNLGTCTSVAEFADACQQHPTAEAMLVGSLNGHVHEDLSELPAAREAGLIRCPVVVGGNLSVGSRKDPAAHERLYALGVDRIVADIADLPAVLDELRAAGTATRAGSLAS